MTKVSLSSTAKAIQAYLPGFAAKSDLLFMSPVRDTLRGLQLERSSNRNKFYINVFFQPLFVPAEHVVLALGWRLGGGACMWGADEAQKIGQQLLLEAVPFLQQIRTTDDLISAARALQQPADGYTQETIAYALAKLNRIEEAVEALHRYASLTNPAIEWQRMSGERARRLAQALVTNPSEARATLLGWEQQTADRLSVASYRLI